MDWSSAERSGFPKFGEAGSLAEDGREKGDGDGVEAVGKVGGGGGGGASPCSLFWLETGAAEGSGRGGGGAGSKTSAPVCCSMISLIIAAVSLFFNS